MSLVDRLAGITDEPIPVGFKKLGVSTFWASLYELAQGQVTKAQMVAYFELDPTEEAELDWIIGRYNAQPNATAKAKFVELMQVLFMLAEAGVPGYTTNADLVARINAI